MAGDIILGYDGSDGAKAALPEAVAVAKSFGAKLVVAFGYEPNPQGGEVADIRHALEQLGEQLTAEGIAAATEPDPDMRVEVAVIDERPVESLIRAAEERHARMIVVGGNGRGPLAGALLGSVAYRLLHHSTVSVLVVQPNDT